MIMTGYSNQSINEAKTAFLYHGTGFREATLILKSNELKANRSNKTETIGVSLTRNPNQAYYSVRLVLDQEKITYNNKISPVYRDGISGRDLAEERLPNNLKNLSRYLVRIDANDPRIVGKIRRKLAGRFGDHDFVIRGSQNKDQSDLVHDCYEFLLMARSKNVRIDKILQECEYWINRFLKDEHDLEYEAKISGGK